MNKLLMSVAVMALVGSFSVADAATLRKDCNRHLPDSKLPYTACNSGTLSKSVKTPEVKGTKSHDDHDDGDDDDDHHTGGDDPGTDDDGDNGHGNDDDHNDDSNPGHSNDPNDNTDDDGSPGHSGDDHGHGHGKKH